MPDTPTKLYGARIRYFTGKAGFRLRWKNMACNGMLGDASVCKDIVVPQAGFPSCRAVTAPDASSPQYGTATIGTQRHPAMDAAFEQQHAAPSDLPTHPAHHSFASSGRSAKNDFALIGRDTICFDQPGRTGTYPGHAASRRRPN